tara:strand:- start:8 stop:547 length:540 start_codon:yes stop_codon:yes gene_type:complete
MPLLDVNNVAILLRTEIDPEDSNVINEFDLFFDRVREVLDNTLGQFQPKILAIDDKGNVHPAHYYEDISPYQKGNEMITTIQTIMKQHLNNLIENDEGYEGPAAEMNFDECIEGDSPYESPMFMSEDLCFIGIIIESQDAFDDVLSGCKKAAKLLGEDGEVEIVDYSGEYEYFNNLIDG